MAAVSEVPAPQLAVAQHPTARPPARGNVALAQEMASNLQHGQVPMLVVLGVRHMIPADPEEAIGEALDTV